MLDCLPQKYKFIKELSKNRNSYVICVQNIQTNEDKVLKIISSESSFYSGILQEFILMKQTRHPNLMEVENFGFLKNQAFYYSMPFFKKVDLFSYCKEKGQSGFLEIFQQLLTALEYLHERNIVHGDLSLDNLFLFEKNGNFTVKISDFGLSSLIASQSIEEISGTAHFIAPELLVSKGKKEINVQSDIYSLGMCMLSLVSNHKADNQFNAMELLKQKVQMKSTIIPKDVYVDERVMEILKKMVAYYPKNRYQTVRAIYQECLPLFKKDTTFPQNTFDFYPYREKVITHLIRKLETHKELIIRGNSEEILSLITHLKMLLNYKHKVCIEINSLQEEISKDTLKKAIIMEYPHGTLWEDIQNAPLFFFLAKGNRLPLELMNMYPNSRIIYYGEHANSNHSFVYDVPKLKNSEFDECMLHFLGNDIPAWLTDFLIANANGNYSLLKNMIVQLQQKKIIRRKHIFLEIEKTLSESEILTDDLKKPYLNHFHSLPKEEKEAAQKISFWKENFTVKELSEIFNYKIIVLQDLIATLKKTELIFQPSVKMKFQHAFQRTDIQKSVSNSVKRNIIETIVNFLQKKDLTDFEEMCLLLKYSAELEMFDVFTTQAEKILSHFTKDNHEYWTIIEMFYIHKDKLADIFPDILLEKLNLYYYSNFQKRDLSVMRKIYDFCETLIPNCKKKNVLDQFWVFTMQKLAEERKFHEILNVYDENSNRLNKMDISIKASLLFIIADTYWELNERKKAIIILDDLLPQIPDEQLAQKIFTVKRLGYYLTQFNQPDRALALFQQGISLAEKNKAFSETGHLFCLIGFIKIEQYKAEEAFLFFEKAQKIRDEYKIHKLAPLIYWGLIPVYLLQGDFWKAMQTSRLSKIHHFATGNVYFYDDLAGILANLGYFDNAATFYQRAVSLAEEYEEPYSRHEYYTFFTEAMLRKKDFKKTDELLQTLHKCHSNVLPRIFLYESYIKTLYYLEIDKINEAENELIVLKKDYKSFIDIKIYYYFCAMLLENKKNNQKSAFYFTEKVIKQLELLEFHFVEAPEMLFHCYHIQKTAFEQKITSVDYKKSLLKAYEMIQERAKKLPTNQMRRHFLQSDYRKEIIQAYEKEITHSNYSELTSQLLNSIAEITNLVGTIRDRQKLLAEILKITLEVTKAERGILFTLFEKKDEPKAEIIQHVQIEALQDIEKANLNIIKSTFTKKKAVFHTEILSDNSFDAYQSYVNFSIQSVVCLPLFIHGKMIGTVYLDSRSLLVFSPEEMTFLNIFAQLAASAIETSQFYQKLQEKNEDLSHLLMDKQFLGKKIIGNSNQIKDVIHKMNQIAPTDVTVLIQGESGTGKELVARGIHELSKRSKRNFVPVDCGSLSEDLIESELFGHKKGAFTGAHYEKKGLFEEADNGTIFLDEISNLSLNTQTKLLRLLQEGEIKRVGDTAIKKVNVRIITASNIELSHMVSRENFARIYFIAYQFFPLKFLLCASEKMIFRYLLIIF